MYVALYELVEDSTVAECSFHNPIVMHVMNDKSNYYC